MKIRLSKDDRISIINTVDQTIDQLEFMRKDVCNDYYTELYDEYIFDIDSSIYLINLLRGILDGSIICGSRKG